MIARCITNFFDKNDRVMRNVGDEFSVSKKRFEEINGTRYGILVAEVKETSETADAEPVNDVVGEQDDVSIEPNDTDDIEPRRAFRGRKGYRNQ